MFSWNGLEIRIYKHYKFTLTNDIPLASGLSLPHRGAQDLNNILCTVRIRKIWNRKAFCRLNL